MKQESSWENLAEGFRKIMQEKSPSGLTAMPIQDLNPVARSQPPATDADFKLPGDVRVRLETELALAEKHLSVALSEFWPAAFQASLSCKPVGDRDLSMALNAMAIRIVFARANALVALGHDVSATGELIENTILPHTVKLLLPTALDFGMRRDRDLQEERFDLLPLGYWENRICSSWEAIKANGGVPSDLDRNWCLPFQFMFRSAANRDKLIESLEAQLNESLIHWRAAAWGIVPDRLSHTSLLPSALKAVLSAGAFDIAAHSEERILRKEPAGATDYKEHTDVLAVCEGPDPTTFGDAPPEERAFFTSEAGRNIAVSLYVKHWTCSQAALARTAKVHPADLSKWKKSRLPARSEKRTRIETAITENQPPTPAVWQHLDH
jgi:hypothetical protein